MGERLSDVHRRAYLVHTQIMAAKKIATDFGGVDLTLDDSSPYLGLLDRLYSEDYQFANLWETSDIIVHAEGPSAAKKSPHASVITWMLKTIDNNLKKLVQSAMQIPDSCAKNIHIQLTGFAPGSIYAGFSLQDMQETAFLAGADSFLSNAKNVIDIIPLMPRFIGKDEISQGITELIQDPITRDAAIIAAFNMSPTGRNGIHTFEFTTPRSDLGSRAHGELSAISRPVLRIAAQESPIMSEGRQRQGSFIGEFRSVDLDKSRLDLRNINAADVGTLRCFIGEVTPERAGLLLGKRVEVTGIYETLPNGRPRFMRVHDIKVLEDLNHHLDFEAQ